MKILLALCLALLALSVQARDYSFNGSKPAVIIDVRTPEEFAAGHIDGAVNIPVEQIAQGIQSVKGLKKDATVLVYCRSGRRSALAATTLEQQGYKHVLNGGGLETLAGQLKACSAKSC